MAKKSLPTTLKYRPKTVLYELNDKAHRKDRRALHKLRRRFHVSEKRRGSVHKVQLADDAPSPRVFAQGLMATDAVKWAEVDELVPLPPEPMEPQMTPSDPISQWHHTKI